jgi:hypothetical protein
MERQIETAATGRTPRRWVRVAVLVAGFTLVAACGDDGGIGAAADEAGDTPAATAGSGSGSGSGGDSGSGGGANTGVSAKCLDAAKAMAAATSAVPMAMAGGAGNLQQSIDQLEAFAGAAPSEIRNDLKTVAEGYAKFAKALKDSGYTGGQTMSPSALQAIQKASAELDKDDFQKASDRVTAWFDKECG